MKEVQLLFLCTQNAARSQMAEGLARTLAPQGVTVFSAGTTPTSVHPLAVRTLAEMGIDISRHCSKSVNDFMGQRFDLVITLCDHARQSCPIFPGAPNAIHWNLEDPARPELMEAERVTAFRQCAKHIKQLVDDLFHRGYLDAFLKEQRNLDAVLSALPQGILCHDLNRRIFIFSKGAENLTGLSAAEVMGRDCHDIFRPLLCGDHCLCRPFQGKTSDLSERSYQTVYRNQSGVRKSFDVTVVPLKDEIGTPTGAMVSLMDRTRVESLERELEQAASFCGIVGQDHGMQVVYDLIRDVAGSDASVVITGESGTGKELVANAIHQESLRRDRLFVPVNCGALPEGTLESELFGHVKGAFTGAIRDKKGRFELADKGTLFLDEVSELKPALQVKLLRVLQEGTFEPVGSEHTIKVDVRIISATNKNLNDLVQKGLFREDLYYRLAVFPLELPPLRVRKNDIPLLAGHFLDHIREKSGRLGLRLSHEALEVLMSFDWPGNVRQLQNAIQYASIKCRAVDIEIQHLPPEIAAAFPLAPSPIPEKRDGRGKPGRKPKLDFASVENVLIKSGGNKSKAARLLQVGRATLYQFIHRNSALKRLTE